MDCIITLVIHTLASLASFFLSVSFCLPSLPLVCLPTENRVDFNLVGGEVACASEGVVSFPSGVDVVWWEVAEAVVVLVGVGVDVDIASTSKDRTT